MKRRVDPMHAHNRRTGAAPWCEYGWASLGCGWQQGGLMAMAEVAACTGEERPRAVTCGVHLQSAANHCARVSVRAGSVMRKVPRRSPCTGTTEALPSELLMTQCCAPSRV